MDIVGFEKKYHNFYAPVFQINVDGKELAEEGVEVTDTTVDISLDSADHFSFSINNPYDVGKKEFKWLDNDMFETGKEVEIRMGYLSTLTTMILGQISSVRPTFPSSGIPQMEISGYDLSQQMMKSKKPNSWPEMTDSDVVKDIASSYNLKTSHVEDTKTKYPKIIKDEDSDFHFIKKLADRNGYEFFVRENNIFFRVPKNDRKEIAVLKWGESLNSFSPELNVANQVSEIEVRHWDPKTKKQIVARAKKGDEHGRDSGKKSGGDLVEKTAKGAVVKVIRIPVNSKEEAEKIAKAALDKLAEGLIKGSGECIGLPDIVAGENIRLEGLGKKFSRTYYLEKATHTISSSGYTTTFDIKENTI
ncbi:MAG: hypothetical protein M8353_00130 [ANME-2 cluster archaeon]|nr:hypothetical protein [ANME-2 cluster archaeon]